MMRRVAVLLALPLMLCFALGACTRRNKSGVNETAQTRPPAGAASVETAAPGELARLCPDGAMAFVRVTDLRKLDSGFAEIAGSIESDAGAKPPMKPSRLIGQQLGDPDLSGVDLSRPFGIALFEGPAGVAPVMLVPVVSKDAFQTAIEQDSMWKYKKDHVGLKYVGSWAVYSMDKARVAGVTMKKKASELASRALFGDVSVSLDMKTISPLVGKELAGMTGNLPAALPEQSRAMLTATMKTVREFLTDSDYLSLAASLDKGALTLGLRYSAKPGTDTAKFLTVAPSGGKDLLSRVGAGGMMTVAMRLSGAKLWSLMEPFFAAMKNQYPADLMAMSRKAAMLCDGVAFRASFEKAFVVSEIAHVTDPKAYEGLVEKLVGDMDRNLSIMSANMPPNAPKFKVKQLKGFDYGGVKVRGISLEMSFPKGPIKEDMQKFFSTVFGGPMKEWFAVVGDYAVVAAGSSGETEVKTLIDRVKSGGTVPTSSSYETATAGFPQHPEGVFFVDLGEFAKLVGQVLPKLAPKGMPQAVRSKLASAPSGLWMSGYYQPHDGTIDAGMRINLKSILEYGKSLASK